MAGRDEGLVLITGAAGGIGRACAAAFPHARKLLVDRDSDRLAELAGPADLVVAGDLRRPETIDCIAGQLSENGGLRAGVHTAAISPTMGDAAEILDLNYVATTRLAERLRDATLPGACLVLIASLAGHRPQDGRLVARLDEVFDPAGLRALAGETDPSGAYALSKHGVIRLAERAAAAWGARGARIVSLSPGVIETPMLAAEAAATDAIEKLLAMAPLARLGRTSEIADAAAFLCSPGASFITGTDLRVDGGVIAALRQLHAASSAAAA